MAGLILPPGPGGDAVVAVVPAAGSGVRLGSTVPKAFVDLAGVPMVRRTVEGLLDSGVVDRVVVVVPDVRLAEGLFDGLPVRVVRGGADRQASVAAGLRAAGDDVPTVLVHDAARPLTPSPVVARVVAAVRSGHGAVVPVIPMADTVKRVDGDGAVVTTVDRSALRSVQTPQCFRTNVIARAHARADDPLTDDAGLVEAIGEPVHTVEGDPLAFKVTTAWDLRIAELVLAGARTTTVPR